MKAIDLYSGIGGWSLGLKLNGIEVINSYEWWDQAVETANKNLNKKDKVVDIREMNFSGLKGIDIVVGSPPCTQFSYSNRGGSGDIEEGIKDLYQFFKCVEVIKPKYWVMENVPRVAKVLETQILPGGQLSKFRKRINEGEIRVINMSEFGLPQKRKRCIAGNIDFDLLDSYSEMCPVITLQDVLDSLKKINIRDPNFKVTRKKVTELEKEEPLNDEELRMNREMKENHPIYNKMNFGENLDSPARTITATCTRVSRESLVVKDKTKFRRLSVRERATIQGFPINYQFHGSSHSNKLKMIGNAIPPKFTYLLAAAMKGIKSENLILPKEISIPLQRSESKTTTPESQSKKYPATRSFKFAIPSLNFKSGTRFELNNFEDKFKCFFYYGDSKRIRNIKLDKHLLNKLEKFIDNLDEHLLKTILKTLKIVKSYDHQKIQTAWSIKPSKGSHPFKIVDLLNSCVIPIHDLIADIEEEILLESQAKIFDVNDEVGKKKIKEHYRKIFCGLLICSYFNSKN